MFQSIAYTSLVWVVLGGLASVASYKQGKAIEKGEWQEANAETLLENNVGLRTYVEDLKEASNKNDVNETATGNQINEANNRVTTQIIKVPIETIKVIEGACPTDNALAGEGASSGPSISYDVIRLRHQWAKSNTAAELPDTTVPTVPTVGTYPLPGRTTDSD